MNTNTSACLWNASSGANCSQTGGGGGFYLSYGAPGLQAFCTYFTPMVVALGLVGNTCSFVILKESASRVSSHFYLCCLSVLDSLTLLSILLTIWLAVILPGYYYVTFGQVAAWLQSVTRNCPLSQFRVYVSFYCRMVAVWTVVILSVERCIAVSSPLRWGTRLCTVRNGIWAVGILVLLAAPFSVYAIFGFEYNEQYKTCRPNEHFFIGSMLSNIFFSVVPWCVICVSNVTLVMVLRRRNRRSSQLDRKTLRQENSVTTRLLVVSIAFLGFTLPVTITSGINSSYELRDMNNHKTGILADLWLVSFVLFTMNFASNFVLYCLTGQNFRRAALALLTCRFDRMRLLRRRLDRGASDSTGGGGGGDGGDGSSMGPSSKLTNVGSLTAQDLQPKQTAALLPKATGGVGGGGGGGGGQKHLRQETNI